LKARQSCPPPPPFQVSRPRRSEVLGHSRRTDGGYLGKPVGVEKINWLGGKLSTSKDKVVWCNSKKKKGDSEEHHRFEHHGKKLFSSYDEKKLKVREEQGKKEKKVGQSVRYRSLWKQGNIKMAASENHATCSVHKDLFYTANNVETLQEAF